MSLAPWEARTPASPCPTQSVPTSVCAWHDSRGLKGRGLPGEVPRQKQRSGNQSPAEVRGSRSTRASAGQPGARLGSALPHEQAEAGCAQDPEEMPWRRGPGGQERPSTSAIPSEQGRARGKGARTGQRPPQGQRREAADPWWWQQAAGACVGGSEEGRREEAGFLKPSQPSKTDQQTDRQLARGAGGHSCFSTYLGGPGRSPAGQGCGNLGRHGRASGGA